MGDTSTPRVGVAVYWDECFKCGVSFGIPESYHRNRLKDGRTFWCPNGHGQQYDADKPTVAQRQELVHALHRAEQAEAAAAEATGKLNPDAPPLPKLPPPTGEKEPAESTEIVLPLRGGWATCPICGKKWRRVNGHTRRHFVQMHGVPRPQFTVSAEGGDHA